MLLEGRTALVTGAASARGIGRATAKMFAAHGARVALVDLDASACEAAAAEIGPEHSGYACDVRDKARCEEVVAQAVRDLGRLDVLANVAGVSRPGGVMDVTPAEYDLVMDVNLRGTMYMSQAAIPHMRAHGGSIICISSVAAQRGGGFFGGAHYAASKGGVIALAKAMARDLAPQGIRVNAIAPSMIDTDIFGDLMTEERWEAIRGGVPMGRVGTAEDVAGACLFLASDLASYVTGTVLDVNGGAHIH